MAPFLEHSHVPRFLENWVRSACRANPAGSGARFSTQRSACRICVTEFGDEPALTLSIAPTRLSTPGRHGRIPDPFLAPEAGSCFPPRPKVVMPVTECWVDRGANAPRSSTARWARQRRRRAIATDAVLNAEGYRRHSWSSRPPHHGLQWRREIQRPVAGAKVWT